MKYDALIFGATGMQGSIVTRDLTERGVAVYVSCSSPAGLAQLRTRYPGIGGGVTDLRDSGQIETTMRNADARVVVNCAEGDWNLDVYRAALAAGAHVIDLGSTIEMSKLQLDLHEAFAARQLCAITGCGSTPGINNVALARMLRELDEVHTVEAGFAWDSNIKNFVVPFSMESILEEFTKPATVLEDGIWQERIPLKTIESRTFRAIGAQRCMLVPHPEVYTFYRCWQNRGLHTIRFFAGFPDHSFDVIEDLAGKLDGKGGVDVTGKGVVPLKSLTTLFQNLYPKPAGYREQENLWVIAEGVADGTAKRVVMECIVPTLPGWEDAGCNIDTGFPASITAQMILDGTITARGSFEPGQAIEPEPFFRALADRGMEFYLDGTRIA